MGLIIFIFFKTYQNQIPLLFQNLIHFEKQGAALQNAIPTPDHYLPLIYTLGLKEKSDNISLFNDELIGGSLSMTSVYIE